MAEEHWEQEGDVSSRQAIRSSLHWPHWNALAVSLILVVGAAYLSRANHAEQFRQDFTRQGDLILSLVADRMGKYEDGLWAGVSTIQAAAGEVSAKQWRIFEQHFNIDEKYPGIRGIGVILPVAASDAAAFIEQQRQTRPDFDIYPSHNQSTLYPIVMVEPLAVNKQAVGLDMAHEANRFNGLMRAMETKTAQITGPIILVQDSNRTPGFLFFAPYYGFAANADDRQNPQNFRGLVYAPFVVKSLLDGTLGQSRRQVSIRISDSDAVIYDELADLDTKDADPTKTRSEFMEIYGRTWKFDIYPSPELVKAHASAEPIIILVGGMSIVGLLLGLFLSLARSNQRAHTLAAEMTLECRNRTTALERSNEELDKFAYVASHDLRAPLRAIDQLAEIVLEDAAGSLPTQSREDLELLKSRVERMDKLLIGLLDYSRIGNLAREPQEIDVIKLVQEIIESSDLSREISVDYSRPMASISAPKAVAETVFSNLISNTLKHHDQTFARVTISYEYADGCDVITYTDDGPGIPYQYHSKVFEMFQTLRPRDEVEGSGMGLALVQKSLLAHGGRIELVERQERGASFRIFWLRPIAQNLRAA